MLGLNVDERARTLFEQERIPLFLSLDSGFSLIVHFSQSQFRSSLLLYGEELSYLPSRMIFHRELTG